MARNPSANVNTLAGLVSPSAPFQPHVGAVNDFALSITYSVGANPAALAVDANDNVWIVNQGANSVTQLTAAGISTAYTAGNLNQPDAIAIDPSGNVWVTNRGNNTVTELTSAGRNVSGSPFSGGGLNLPSSLAFDTYGNVWISNAGANILSELSATGAPVVTFGYSVSGSSGLLNVSVNPK